MSTDSSQSSEQEQLALPINGVTVIKQTLVHSKSKSKKLLVLSYSNPGELVSLYLASVQKWHLRRGHIKDPMFSLAYCSVSIP